MLNNGIKIVLEMSGDSIRAEVVVNSFSRIINVGVDLKSWKISFNKKPYSVKLVYGPLVASFIHLEKMNNYFNDLLKNKDSMDYTEM